MMKSLPTPDESWPEGFARGPGNRAALLVLASLRGLTPRKLLELSRTKRTASACLETVKLGLAGSPADSLHARSADAAKIESSLQATGGRMVAPGDAEYDGRLLDLADPPAALFVRGSRIDRMNRRVAVVGARNCSAGGREIAREIGRYAASAGICVVSGAARGIDTASHEGALTGGGKTIAVLGSGIDVDYPPENRELIEHIVASGAVVCEYAPGVPAEPFRFPARNRIVAALASALVVVEGADGSGSLISADHALDLGRAIYAVPSAVTNPLGAVPLSLLRDGATMIRGGADLLEDMGFAEGSDSSKNRSDLSVAEQTALSFLAGPTLPETVAAAMKCSLADVLSLLLQLEIKGVVRNVGGRFESRISVRG